MGGGNSVQITGGSLNDIVEKLMPLYYQTDAVTKDDIYTAENSWRVILDGNSPMMADMREATGLTDADGQCSAEDIAVLYYDMLCYAVLRSDLLCYAMLCYAMLCYAMLCYAVMWCDAMCCGVMCCGVMCYAILRYAVLCCFLLCPFLMFNGFVNAGMDLYRELFFTRLFDIHEEAKPLFTEKAVRSGKFLGSVMNLCFTQLQDPKVFRKKIAALAESHCQMGIRTIEYGVIGDVLFWSLHIILRDMYTRKVEKSWLRLFSSMLRIIVPIAVGFERDGGRFKRAAAQRAANSTMFFSTRGRNSVHAGQTNSVLNLYTQSYTKVTPIMEDGDADESVAINVKN
jgi:hemoglobin-like flavoprotein